MWELRILSIVMEADTDIATLPDSLARAITEVAHTAAESAEGVSHASDQRSERKAGVAVILIPRPNPIRDSVSERIERIARIFDF